MDARSGGGVDAVTTLDLAEDVTVGEVSGGGDTAVSLAVVGSTGSGTGRSPVLRRVKWPSYQ